MEGAAGQMVVPILGIVAAAAVTFYTVSFMEMRDKSFEELDDKYSELDDDESGGRQRRSRRRAERDRKRAK